MSLCPVDHKQCQCSATSDDPCRAVEALRDRIEADEALMRQALEALEGVSDCYTSEDDEAGECASCHERSYKPHAPTCKKNNAIAALRARLVAAPARKATALEQFQSLEAEDQSVSEMSPLERLRFFCSLAMNGQDWLDVEPFFDAVAASDELTCEQIGADVAALRARLGESKT